MSDSISKKRGFAGMTPEARSAIASLGGKAAHAQGTAHAWDKRTARDAGRKGGLSVAQNREHMAAIGRKGGQNRARNAKRLMQIAQQDAKAELLT